MLFQKLVYYSQLGNSHARFMVDLSRTLRCLRENGWRLTGGDKVGSVILEGKGRLYNCVKPCGFVKMEEVDMDYYITHQVLPAASRILSFLYLTEAKLLKETKKTKEIRSLMDYV